MTDTSGFAPTRRNIRLDTLVRLRWLSVIGQTIAVLVVYFGFEFDLPIWACLSVIALSAWLNIALRLRFRHNMRIEPDRTAWLLAFDIAQLAIMMFLTGGLENPFAYFFLGPVLLSATALPPRMTTMLGIFAMVCATVLVFFHYPLPWRDVDRPLFPADYLLGIWLSNLLAIVVIGIYARQIAEEQRRLADALAATELVLAREQHLSQIDGIAAAAAHALGTPLSTISVVVKELERAIPPTSEHADDIKLLREQAERCREILARLNALPAEQEPFIRLPLPALLEEVVAPHRDFGIAIDIVLSDDSAPPLVTRNAAILYGLGNILENAVDFAGARVEVMAEWDDDEIVIVISDDGPGFAPEVLPRIGEPYVRSRRRRRMYARDDTGLGLGFFIAKTLLERSGAKLSFVNRQFPQRGAIVTVRWPRTDFEVLPQSHDLEDSAANA